MDPAEIAVALARIEGKLDLLNAQSAAQASRSDDHEARIRSLERLVWRAAGAATMLGALSGAGLGSLFS